VRERHRRGGAPGQPRLRDQGDRELAAAPRRPDWRDQELALRTRGWQVACAFHHQSAVPALTWLLHKSGTRETRIWLNDSCAHEAHIRHSRHRCSPTGFAACFDLSHPPRAYSTCPQLIRANIDGNSRRWRHAVGLWDPQASGRPGRCQAARMSSLGLGLQARSANGSCYLHSIRARSSARR
jgi:hypothetical protein